MAQCKQCDKEFVANTPKHIYCFDCQKERARERAREYNRIKRERKQLEIRSTPPKKRRGRVTPSQTLEEIDRERIAYNEAHGTRLSYGKFVALRRMDKLKGG